ncbi:MAG TPA: extracellular solute-binding protein, partial [Burkholderiales bacterium]|nr:extracellular solute-binding protein [Burkholderiales bacterium]
MKRTLALLAIATAFAAAPAIAQQTTLNVVTAGDQNMVDYIKDFLAPRFEKTNPKAVVKAVGTGPGDSGSQKIAEKLQAQKGNAAWDVDVAVIHQKMAGDLVREGLLAPYVRDVSTGRLVSSEASKNALGTNVQGYVIPMFQSQTAIAWNPALVKNPPKNYEELAAWAKANPKKFGYNGIKG